jgi:hypothetical protein
MILLSRENLLARFHLELSQKGQAGSVRLAVQPGSVASGAALDKDKAALAEQAYQVELSPNAIEVSANAPAGLFYRQPRWFNFSRRKPRTLAAARRIECWPDLQFRAIYWDDAHHRDRPEYLKHAIRQAAFFKLNFFAIKLEGHFQCKSVPVLVEPYALSPADLRELTDYGRRYHAQLPSLDGPAHIAFILKHPSTRGCASTRKMTMSFASRIRLLTSSFWGCIRSYWTSMASSGISIFPQVSLIT